MSNIIKVGLDVHGVIDKDPEIFALFTHRLFGDGHEVHILTGREICDELTEKLQNFGITYSHLFSITSYHKEIGTYIKFKDDDPTQPLIAPPKWNRTKAYYANKVGLDIHIDDSFVYGEYFHRSTQYILYTPVVRTLLEIALGI